MQAHSELAPKGLKYKVQNELDYRIPSAKADVRKLYERIRVKAKEQEMEERALKKANPSRHKNEKTNIKLNPKQNKRHIERHDHRPIKTVKQERGNDLQKKPNGRSGRQKERQKMGVSIAEEHTICPNAPLQPLPSVRNYSLSTNKAKIVPAERGGTAKHKKIKACLPNQNQYVLLENKVEVPCCIGSGADRSCLDESCFKRLTNVKPDIVRVKLAKPLKCTMADNTSVLVDWIVKLNLRLQTIAGVATPEHFYDLLIRLRIDVDRQVDLLAVGTTDVNDDEFDKVDEPTVTNSTVHDDEVRKSVFEMVEKAIRDGFPLEYQNELTRIALKFDLWRNDLGADPPSKITADKNSTETGKKISTRRTPLQEDFNNKLVELGWIYKNRESRWAYPALPVRKGNGEFRQTADYKPMNELVEAIVGEIPNLQIALEVVQGAMEQNFSVCLISSKVSEEVLHRHLLVWINDLLRFANDVHKYLTKLERLFELLDFFGFKLSVKKSRLFKRQVRWCGKIIWASGVHHEPEHILLLAATKGTKRVAAGIGVRLTIEQQLAYNESKNLLASSVELAFPGKKATTCVMTDASDIGWSVIVGLVANWLADQPVHLQQHQLLTCLSGTFSGPQRNWSIIEKEAYPIICACDKLSYLLLRSGEVKLYRDHRNLIYVFAPRAEVKKHILGKLSRWATKLAEYRYEIEHIEDTANV
ncbi:LOW QUALITY PROTEIN: hypothetical protein PHMEG_00018028 [Phytophthora megakarya]|uniref:Reverse transcriptase RNase H-like domain-containing protein n=1 Tax=Phytophthora megakarya TaxID=4795 RepID=A0A225VUT9_9STRA|nr:LOW QUALITY PROTEIN: hypothetical protein PHMEG_00018028 [Phytophthora megakarya]